MLRWLVCLSVLVSFQICAQVDDGLTAYKEGNFAAAIPLLETAHSKTPEDAVIEAALLSSLVSDDRLDRAAEVDADAARFSNIPEVLTARAEFAFHMGDMPNAEQQFKSALQLKDTTARALFGLARLYRAASFYRSSRLLVIKAHDLNPDDALITQAFLRYVPPAKRDELLNPFVAAHPWLYKHYQEQRDNADVIRTAAGEKTLFERDGPAQEAVLNFKLLLNGPQRVRGVGLEIRIGNGHPIRVLFDSGATGILLRQSVIDKAGLAHIGKDEVHGVGDSGPRNIFYSVADTCQINTLRFRNCLINAIEGKRAIADEEDGLIGADFFQDYVVTIDFLNRQLRLKPLPPRPANPQGYDRVVPPDETGFTPVYRLGHMLMVSTVVNRKSRGLFLLDTGAQMNNIDATFARLSTKLRGSDMRIHGVSGNVKQVYEASKGELQFGRFRQDNIGLVAINLNNSSDPPSIRLAGILGLSVLQMFRLTIDYRNGLVNFDYVLK